MVGVFGSGLKVGFGFCAFATNGTNTAKKATVKQSIFLEEIIIVLFCLAAKVLFFPIQEKNSPN